MTLNEILNHLGMHGPLVMCVKWPLLHTLDAKESWTHSDKMPSMPFQ